MSIPVPAGTVQDLLLRIRRVAAKGFPDDTAMDWADELDVALQGPYVAAWSDMQHRAVLEVWNLLSGGGELAVLDAALVHALALLGVHS